jgi:4-hydroxybenzoate polyprenyltransferase
MNRRPFDILDLLFLLRPALFYPVWTVFIAGFWTAGRYGAVQPVAGGPSLWIRLLPITLVMGGVYVLNQIKDRETDLANGKLFLLAKGIVPLRAAATEAVVLTAAGLASAFCLGLAYGLVLAVLFLLAGVFYNFPPMSWKDRPIPGLCTNAIGGGIVFLAGWWNAAPAGLVPLEAAGYGCAVAAAYLSTTLPDLAGDAKSGKRTFPVRYGIGPAVVGSLVLEAAAVLISLACRHRLLWLPAALALPFFIRAAATRLVADSVLATKLAILALAVSVCAAVPFFLVPLAAVFCISRWYYRTRFGLDYPNLKGA